MVITAFTMYFEQRQMLSGEVTVGDGTATVRVMVARTADQLERGLSGTKELPEGEGMLFLFGTPGIHKFWMKDMNYPLDILWMADGTLVDISTDVPVPVPGETLPLYAPKVPIDAVLEVPAGFAAAHGLKLGIPVNYSIDNK